MNQIIHIWFKWQIIDKIVNTLKYTSNTIIQCDDIHGS